MKSLAHASLAPACLLLLVCTSQAQTPTITLGSAPAKRMDAALD